MAKNLTGLPVELLIGVVSLLDRPSLEELRCTCRLFRELTTPKLFETLQLFPRDENCRRLKSLLQGNTVGHHVRNVYLNTYEKEWDPSPEADLDYYDQWVDRELLDESSAADDIKEQISSLDQFPHLNHVTLCFERHCYMAAYELLWREPPQNLWFREAVLKSFFSFLVSSPVRLQSLAIRNFQNTNISNLEIPATMVQVLQGLRALCLDFVSMTMGREVEYLREYPRVIPELPSIWLNPTTSSLEHLTLYSDECFGLYPTFDLSSTHFLRLKSLRLGNYTFCHDVQVDWIISHARTLRELYLDNCTILHEAVGWNKEDLETYYSTLLSEEWKLIKRKKRRNFYLYKYPRRWHDYFTMFRTGLPLLRHFRIGKSSWGRGFPSEKERDIIIRLSKDRYFHWDEAYATVNQRVPYEMKDLPFCQVEDNEALCVLFRKIGQSVGEQNWIR